MVISFKNGYIHTQKVCFAPQILWNARIGEQPNSQYF